MDQSQMVEELAEAVREFQRRWSDEVSPVLSRAVVDVAEAFRLAAESMQAVVDKARENVDGWQVRAGDRVEDLSTRTGDGGAG